ncbi:ABC transporter permease [Hymenobacter antarcticus]|uniref:ABC transporter permease n=1 Tax=Hymenobacter antarcticus TaxID=486270 RepID=A0ABP7P579_9BACT
MLRHFFRLIWNRKRSSMLLLSEIFFSFVVLFGVATLLFNFGRNYVAPFGFNHDNVWRLSLAAGQGDKMPRAQLDDVLRQVRALPGVQDVSLTSFNTPFRFVTMNDDFARGDKKLGQVDRYDADDHYGPLYGLKLREGRWFNASDDAATRPLAVISQDTREALFGPDEPAVGKIFRADHRSGSDEPKEYQVVGVVDKVRMSGDFAAATPSVWERFAPHDTTSRESATMLVRVAPGQGAPLQQRMVRTIASLTRQSSTQVYALEQDRLDKLKPTLAPLAALGLIAVFLVVNVALGLFGVLWYNISQRRTEIGLRRALGATGPAISWQFLAEMLILTTLGVLAGALVAAQFPLLSAFDVAPEVYVMAMLLATAVIFVLTAVCAWQPSRLAAGIHPAVALREE